jgi:hypothetical protein
MTRFDDRIEAILSSQETSKLGKDVKHCSMAPSAGRNRLPYNLLSDNSSNKVNAIYDSSHTLSLYISNINYSQSFALISSQIPEVELLIPKGLIDS